MKQSELCVALDLSKGMVSRLCRAGMPTHSAQAAEEWRRQHLSIAHVKRGRTLQLQPADELVRAADQMLALAATALSTGNRTAFDALVPACRAALHAVPRAARDGVQLPFDVMTELCQPVVDIVRETEAEDPSLVHGPLSDAEAEAMGKLWYSVAAGKPFDLPE